MKVIFAVKGAGLLSILILASSCSPKTKTDGSGVNVAGQSTQIADVRASTVFLTAANLSCSGAYICADGADASRGEIWVLTGGACVGLEYVNFGSSGTTPDASCRVIQSIPHPEFGKYPQTADMNTFIKKEENDLMLVKASCGASLPQYAQCVPVAQNTLDSKSFLSITAAGFDNPIGSQKEFAPQLKKISTFISHSDSKWKFFAYSTPEGESPCDADGGGPIFLQKNNQPTLLGIITHPACDRFWEKVSYGVHLKQYIPWISSHAGNLPSTSVKRPVSSDEPSQQVPTKPFLPADDSEEPLL